MKRILLLNACFIFSLSMAFSQQIGQQSLSQLKESPAGSKIITYLDLLNSGEKVTSENIKQLFSQKIIDKHGINKLINIFSDIRDQDGKLSLYEADRTETFRYELILRSGNTNDWLSLNMNFEESSPYKIEGIEIRGGSRAPKKEKVLYQSGTANSTQKKGPKYIPDNEASLNIEKIAKAYENLGWFSGAVLLAKNGKPIFQKAFGYADEEKKIKNTTATKFRIGSINKDYTAVLVLQQMEKGVLSLDDRLSKFDLGFPKKIANKVSVRQLLNHSSGFGDIFIPEYLDNIRSYKNINDILPLLMNEPLAYEPGTDQQYSNYGYVILGAILEKTTGKSFDQLLQDNILSKINAKNTHYDIAENIKGEAKSYRFNFDGSKTDHTAMLEYPTPDGGIYANTSDLLSFIQALFYSKKLISNASKILMAADYQNTEMKWEELLANPNAGTALAGGGPGVSATIGVELKEKYILIVLANTDQGIAEHILRKATRALKGEEYSAPNLPVSNFLYKKMKEKGGEYLSSDLNALLEKGGYEGLSPRSLNQMGYTLMRQGKIDEAIEIFQMNVQLFPSEANPYDSLGEAYLEKGDKANALKYYKKALELDPNLPSAKKMIKQLEN